MNAEQSVLAAIAELEAEENPDDITELVRWQLTQGLERGDHEPEDVVEIPFFPQEAVLEEVLAQLGELHGVMVTTMCPEPSPDAPYREYRQLEPGERVGWTDENGRVHVGVVKENVEHPEGSGNWTLELEPESG